MEIKDKTYQKKLSHNIKRISGKNFINHYTYEFTTNQFLEEVDNFEDFGIAHSTIKDNVIEGLVNEFRLSLTNVVYGDLSGKMYLETFKK